MDNPYAQFGFSGAQDAPPPASSVGADTSSGSNPYAQFGPSPTEPSAEPDTSKATLTSAAKNFGTGLLAGLPNALTFVEHALTPPGFAGKSFKGEIDPNGPTTVGEVAKRGMGLLGFDPDNPEQMPQPQNAPERIARMTGEGASGMMVPGLGTGSTLGNLALGASSGLGAGIGRELAPDRYKDVAGLAGGLIGGGLGAGMSEVPSAVGSAWRAGKDYVAPFTKSGQEALAAKTLSNAATDPEAAIQSLSDGASQIVPGSAPTTFQATGDMGLGQLERAAATKNPKPFLDRRVDQNEARLNALSDIQAEGHPEAVGSFFRDQLDQIDQQMQAAHDAAATSARSAVEGIGGGQPTEVLGEQARTALQNSLDAAKTNERSLWKAVDPEGNMQVAATPLKNAYADVYGSLGPEASIGMAPVEKQLGDVIQGYGDALPLQRMIDLRSAVSKAMRDANSPLQANSMAYGRLSQLRGAVEDAISDSITQKAAQEQQAVQMGAMQPQDSMAAKLAAQRSEWLAGRNQQEAAGTGGGGYSRSNGAGRSSAVSGASGTDVSSGSGFSNAQGATGFPTNAGRESQFIDQATADRLKSATAATAQRKQTFGEKPVSQILQRPGTTQPYNLPGGAVSASAWKAGTGGADAVNSILKASPEALGPLKEIAASSLRAKASDGILTSKQLDAWKAQHAPALKALEKASPGSTAVFENAARAGDHLAQLAQQRKDAMTAFERSSVGRLMKLDDPADVVKSVGSIFNRNDSVKAMRQLAQAASKDPTAMAGLRRAVVEHMENKLISNTEAGTSGKNLIKSDAFQTFLGKNYTALRQVFSDQELGSMRAIAQDLKRANRSIASSKLPGQSNTAQDLSALASSDLKPTLLNKILTHAIGGGAGFAALGDVTGTLAGVVGTHVIGGMRESGLNRVQDLISAALLDPELAKSLLMKAPKKIDTGSEISLASKLRRVGAQSAIQNYRQ